MAGTYFELADNAETTLNGDLTDVADSIVVTSVATLPSSFPYLLTIWDENIYPDPSDDPTMEIVLVGGATGTTLTSVTRGYGDTSGVAHVDTNRISLLITKEIFTDATYGIEPIMDAHMDATTDEHGVGSDYITKTSKSSQIGEFTSTVVIGRSGAVDYICDGVDDHVQIQAAIDAVSALGSGIILIKAGTYNINAALTGFSDIPIVGEDKYSTILHVNDCNLVTPVTNDVFILENITVTGENTTAGQGMVFNTENVYFSTTVRNCIISTLVTPFLALNDYEGGSRTELGSFVFTDNDFIDCGRTNDPIFGLVNNIGILMLHGPKASNEELRIVNNNFYKITATQKDGLSAINLTGNSTSGDGTDPATSIQSGIVSGNYIQEQPHDPMYISDTTQMIITNNRIGISGRFGSSFNRGYRNLVQGNIIVECGFRAFRLEHNTFCVWSDNHCLNANTDPTSTDAAVVFPSCHDNIFTHNSFNTDADLPAYRVYDTISGSGTTYPAYNNWIIGNRHTGSDEIDYRDGCQLLNSFYDIRNYDNTPILPQNCRTDSYIPLNYDNDLKDMITGDNATVGGSPTWVDSHFGKSTLLNTLDEYINTGVSVDMSRPFSISFEYYPLQKVEGVFSNIVCTYRSSGGGQQPIRISKQDDGEIQVNIFIGTTEYAINMVEGDYPDDESMFLTTGWDGDNLFLYVNGELYAVETMPTPTTTDLTFLLGARYTDDTGAAVQSETPNLHISHFRIDYGIINQVNARCIWNNYKNQLYPVFHSDRHIPVGNFTAPSVPASTVNYTNQFGYPCQVQITGGTVTDIDLDDIATGLTSGIFIIPTGGTINITYSVVPTWVWWGL